MPIFRQKHIIIITIAFIVIAFSPIPVMADNKTQTEEIKPLTTGFIVKDGGILHYSEDGKMDKGWQDIDGSRYYFSKKNGKMKKGLTSIKGEKYYFSKKNGKMKKGFQSIKGYGYYFDPKTGAMVKNKKVKYLKIPKSGKLPKAYGYGIRVLNKQGWKLKNAYTYSYKTRYANRWMRKKPLNNMPNMDLRMVMVTVIVWQQSSM